MRRPFQLLLDGTTMAVLALALFLLTRPSSAVRTEWSSYSARRATIRATEKHWITLVAASAPLSDGARSYDVIEVSDYDCPFCRASSAAVDSAVDAGVRIGYLHYPLRIHPHAARAARMAFCAEDVGRFRNAHRLLMRDTAWHDQKAIGRMADEADLPDTSAFLRCVDDSRTGARVQASVTLAESLGIRGTPTFLTPRGMHQGSTTLNVLLGLVRDP
ncbi:MAG: thioredoxin domain-containing protein [Gemmatimonadetes bacterium]|nr:thioredoxin domain-containing protein [Gemmatimonadota bacterium]